MGMPRPLPEPVVDLLAERFRAIGEPLRIRILDQLRDGPMTVAELTAALDANQQNVSKHLGVLLRVGIVAREKRGTSSSYSLADRLVIDLCDSVCASLRMQTRELAEMLGETS